MYVCVALTVSSFARKTGDYQSLSAVDLKLIALTYQLETECGPEKGAQLRTEPPKSVSVSLPVCNLACKEFTV